MINYNKNKMNILVVGGAGYIGSHMCKLLAQNDYTPIVLDNLVYGHPEAVKWGPFIKGTMDNNELLEFIFNEYEIQAVMHFAAFAYVGESTTNPGKYFTNNVSATVSLLEAMRKNNIFRFIFSSTCATYGEPTEIPITENHPQNPINPYGRSKLFVEHILRDYQKAYGFNSISLRYFNAAGADPDGEIGEDHNPETHLIPLVLQVALDQKKEINIFGDDYPTEDGTCIRDYIHVNDIAEAHLLALEHLLDDKEGEIYNLGNGEGYSVKKVIEIARKVTGLKISARILDRRPGDPVKLIGSGQKAIKILGWKPKHIDLESIIETAWRWHKNHPMGYK
jgi:UDP-glucose 4-epimerase